MTNHFKLNLVLLAAFITTGSWAAEDVVISPASGGGVTINSDASTPAIKVLPGQKVQLPGLATSTSYTNVVCGDSSGVLGKCDTSAIVGAQGPAGVQGPAGPAGPQGPTGIAGANVGLEGVGLGNGVLTYVGAWDSGATYAVNEVVTYNGRNYYSQLAGNTAHSPDVFVEPPSTWWMPVGTYRKDMTLAAPGSTSLMSIKLTGTQTGGGRIFYTVRATDGGSQIATEEGVIQWLATANSITCTVQTTDKLHLGTVNSGCTPGFFNPGSQPGVSIFDNVSFSTPAPIVIHEVIYRLETMAATPIRLE